MGCEDLKMPKTNRDDFNKDTVLRAAQRTAFRCSFCRVPTIGPSRESNNAVSNIGVAAHICAAAPGGKRYDPNMTKQQRKSIDNCIWMCQVHAHLIDTDEKNSPIQNWGGKPVIYSVFPISYFFF